MSPARRILLVIYGLGVAVVLTWVPWRGGLEVRGGNRDTLGYGLVWSPPKPSAATIAYEAALDAHLKSNSLGFVPSSRYILGEEPKKPEGYIPSFVYKSATVEYGKVFLELGALTGLLLVAWVLTSSSYGPREKHQRGEVA